jgi:hypothetical protein
MYVTIGSTATDHSFQGQKKTLGSKLAGAIYRKLGEVVTVYAAQLEPVKFEDGRGTLLR